MASSQSEEDCLLVSLELVDGIHTIVCTQPSLPLVPVLVSYDGLGLSVGHGVIELFHPAACLGKRISLLISSNSTVRGDPLECNS